MPGEAGIIPSPDPRLYPRCVLHLYHERQAFLQCGRHTINNLLQAPVYSAGDFEQLARLLEAGYFFGGGGGTAGSCRPAASLCSCSSTGSFFSPPRPGSSSVCTCCASSSSAVASAADGLSVSVENGLHSDLPHAAPGSVIHQGRSQWDILSAMLGTSYSAPLWLGNYDLSLLELILGQHKLHLHFGNDVEFSKRPSGEGVSHRDTEKVYDRDRAPTIPGGAGQDFPGAVTLEQLRNPLLEGFVVNVALPRTGWRRLLPRTASRHFYAIRKLKCEYTSDVGQYGYTVLSSSKSQLVVKLPWTETSSDSDARPTAPVCDRDCASCLSRTDCRDDKQHLSDLNGPPEVFPPRTCCWVNLDSKLAIPRVFRSEGALMVYLNKKLAMRYQQSLQRRGQQWEQDHVHTIGSLASSGNAGRVGLKAGLVSGSEVSQTSTSTQAPSQTEGVGMDGPSLYASFPGDVNNPGVDHDNYTDAVVIEVLRDTGA